MDQPNQLLTVREAAQMLRVSRETIRAYRKRGWLPEVKIGVRVRFLRSDLENLIARGRTEHDPQRHC